tara:strand:- start:47 stop:823 length:777 start_codon:yes stop_codon:yes gene_type:complete
MTQVVILAGGLGTRLSEETNKIPKPMVEIGDQPILWHIMKIYESYGFKDFIICGGYKSSEIKKYFLNYNLINSDVDFNTSTGELKIIGGKSENWNVKVIDTGEETMTGGRIKRVQKYVSKDNYFLMTYGDGLANVNVNEIVKFHNSHGKLATVTAVQPEGRFGMLDINDGDSVINFYEKPAGDGGYINGGFFVLSPKIFEYIDGDQTIWEQEPMKNLSKDNQLNAFKHKGFWKPMDTLRDKNLLIDMWNKNSAPWKIW